MYNWASFPNQVFSCRIVAVTALRRLAGTFSSLLQKSLPVYRNAIYP